MLTDNKILLEAAKKNYDLFKVSVCNIEALKVKRTYTNEQKADLDYKTSVNKIGEIVNLAACINSKMWDELNNGKFFDEIKEMYYDVCQLNAQSGVEIDSAKKEFTIDNAQELKLLRKKYLEKDDDEKTVKPYFFKYIQKYKGYYDPEKNNYKMHKTTMDYLEKSVDRYRRRRSKLDKNTKFIKFYSILKTEAYKPKQVYREQVARIIRLIKDYRNICGSISSQESLPNDVKYKRKYEERQKLIEYIGKLKFSNNTMVYMLKTLDNKKYKSIYKTIFEILFGYPNTSFYEFIQESKEPAYSLEKDENGKIQLYNIKFSPKICKK